MKKKIQILKPERHAKAWGYELWLVNNDKYCGKILHFNKDTEFSMHYHLLKTETWYVSKGMFELRFFDLDKAVMLVHLIGEGTVIDIPIGQPHQLKALKDDCEIFEISTTHYEFDSYRIAPGNSQK